MQIRVADPIGYLQGCACALAAFVELAFEKCQAARQPLGDAVLFALRQALQKATSPLVPTLRDRELTRLELDVRQQQGGASCALELAGLLMSGGSLGAPLAVGAGMKITYDVMLYLAFRKVKPPEERAAT